MAGRRELRIAPELAMEAFRHGYHWNVVVEEGLPPATRLINAEMYYDTSGGREYIGLLVESDEWPDLVDGEPVPCVLVKIHELRDGDDVVA